MQMNESIAEVAFKLLSPLRVRGGLVGATAEQRRDVATAACALATWSAAEMPNQMLLRLSAELVLDTIDVDVDAGVNALEVMLSDKLVAELGYVVVPTMSKRAEPLITLAPQLLERLYEVAFFGHDKIEDGQANLGNSRILALTMSKRQLFDDAEGALVKLFPKFLAAQPEAGMRIVASVIERHVAENNARTADMKLTLKSLRGKHGERPPRRKVLPESFTLRGRIVRYQSDASSIWGDAGVYAGDSYRGLIDEWERWLLGRATAGENVTGHVEFMLGATGLAVIWNRILRVARKVPGSVDGLVELVTTPKLLLATDVRSEMAKLVAVVHAREEGAREAIETAVLKLPTLVDAEIHDTAARIRRAYASAIAEPATDALRKVKAAAAKDEQERRVRNARATAPSAWVDDDYDRASLREAGVPLDDPDAVALSKVVDEMRRVARAAREGDGPELDDAKAILELVDRVDEQLAETPALHSAQVDDARRTVGEALSIAAHSGGFDDEPQALKRLVRRALEHCARDDDGELNEGLHITEAGEAAEALMLLVRFDGVLDDEVLGRVKQLAKSPNENVRRSIALYANLIVETAPDAGWQLVAELSADASDLVLGAVVHALSQLARTHPRKVHEHLRTIVTVGHPEERTAERATALIAMLYVHHGVAVARETFDVLLKEFPSEKGVGIGRVGHEVRLAIESTFGEETPDVGAAQARAWELLTMLALRGRDLWDRMLLRFEDRTQPLSAEEKERVTTVVELVDYVASQLHYAAEASGRGVDGDARKEAKRKVFERAQRALTAVTPCALPRTAHSLVEMLIDVAEGAPRDVFLAMRDVVRAAKEHGYAHEEMGQDKVVAFVRRNLAEQRGLLQQDAACRAALEELLSIFAMSGFREAIHLTKELDGMFR